MMSLELAIAVTKFHDAHRLYTMPLNVFNPLNDKLVLLMYSPVAYV